MCEAASFIVTMNDVLFSEKSDSHEEIIRENKLDDSDINFVRVEISPPNHDYRLALENWVFSTNQKEIPEWYNAKNAEKFCREKLPIWAKFHIFTKDSKHGGGNLSLIFLSGNHIVNGQTGGGVRARNTSTVRSSGQTGGYVWAYGGIIVKK